MNLVAKKDILASFKKSLDSYEQEAIVQKEMADELTRALHPYGPVFGRTLEIGSGTGFLTRKILDNYQIQHYFLNDLIHYFPTLSPSSAEYSFIQGDAETIPLPKDLDLLISGATLQWLHAIKTFFSRIPSLLKKKGLFAFSSFTLGNHREIKSIFGLSLPYLSLDEFRFLLTDHFDIIYSKSWERPVFFDSLLDLLKHLKKTGVNSLGSPQLSKSKISQLEAHYQSLFGNSKGLLPLTYCPVLFIARKKT